MSTVAVPGPKGRLFFGHLHDFSADQPEYLRQLAMNYGDVAHIRLVNKHVYLLANPDHVRQVLITDRDKFEKSTLDRQVLSKFLGNGLLTSEGDFHRRQRSLAQPAFHSQRINAYAATMVRYTEEMLAGWTDGQSRDIAQDMMRLTMRIVSKCLFDADAVTGRGDTAAMAGQAVHDLQTATNRDFQGGYLVPDWLPTANNRLRRQALAIFDETIEAIIAQRRASTVQGQVADQGDLLSMLMLAEDEEGATMDDRQLRDEVATLFAAGHETTSNALSWTWFLLSQNPEEEVRLHAELDAVLNGRAPTLADLPSLPYTLMVIKEALRLYPPAWLLNGRMPLVDVQIGGYTIPRDSIVFISPYVLQRLPQYFPDPERFQPERFTPEREKDLPRYTYMPFGAGPRICIGNAFALMEAHLILATIARRFRFSLQPGYQIGHEAKITMSPRAVPGDKGSLPVIVQARSIGEDTHGTADLRPPLP